MYFYLFLQEFNFINKQSHIIINSTHHINPNYNSNFIILIPISNQNLILTRANHLPEYLEIKSSIIKI